MTLSEFKAWFEGFSEGIEAAPTEAQFAKIKAKVALIDGAPVTERIYVDRYIRDYRYWSDHVWYGSAPSVVPLTATFGPTTAAGAIGAIGRNDGMGTLAFDSHAAMRELGRAEALN